MLYWWLSFADPKRPQGTQFLGACLILADSFVAAVNRTNGLGINPGGEVQGWPLPAGFVMPPGSWTDRLLTRAECEAFDRAAHAEEAS